MSVSPHKSTSPGFRCTARLMFVTQSLAESFKKKIGLVDDKLWRAETGFVFSPPSRTNEERN
jgi:hypothetical protein